jgi:hypothetical protein
MRMFSGLMSRCMIPLVSDLEEACIAIYVEQRHPPYACKAVPGQLLEAGPYQFGGLSEVATHSDQDLLHLPLACLDSFRIQVAYLQMCEELLRRGAIVGIRACKHYWDPQGSHGLQGITTDVVACTVEQADRVLPPSRLLLVEDLCEPLQERAEHALISVRLADGKIDPAIGVERSQ